MLGPSALLHLQDVPSLSSTDLMLCVCLCVCVVSDVVSVSCSVPVVLPQKM